MLRVSTVQAAFAGLFFVFPVSQTSSKETCDGLLPSLSACAFQISRWALIIHCRSLSEGTRA
eukprot:15449938-Alexandrium_andersonii.AAC.1